MDDQKQSERYSNNWKRSNDPQRPGGYQNKSAPSSNQNATGAGGQTAVTVSPSAKVPGTGFSEKIKDFRDLHVWKLGKELVADIYQATKTFPADELCGLTTQMRRAAISIPSNISEGYNRRCAKDYQRFLSFALGSCAELETEVEVCRDLKYLASDAYGSILEKINHETRMIRSLMNKL